MKRAEFIKYFQGVACRVLTKELSEEDKSESEFLEEAYGIIYKKLRHIKTGQ